jgi:hypothetical protein
MDTHTHIIYYNTAHTIQHQLPRIGSDPFLHLTTLEEAEIIPSKHSDTRIKPLTNGHGRYITATPERTPSSVGKWPLHLHITVINL